MAKQPTPHSCEKAADLAVLQEQVDDLTHIIKDNGQPGLATTVIKLAGVTERLSEDVKDLGTVVSGLEKFMTDVVAEKRQVDKSNTNLKWVLSTVLVLVMILWGTGIFKKKDVINYYLPAESIRGEKLDSMYLNSDTNPVMKVDIN